MSKNSQASIFGGFTQNEFDELVRKISNNKPIYQKMRRDCPECKGDGFVLYERPEPWVSRDLPPSLEEYQATCENCGGVGDIEIDPDLDLLD